MEGPTRSRRRAWSPTCASTGPPSAVATPSAARSSPLSFSLAAKLSGARRLDQPQGSALGPWLAFAAAESQNRVMDMPIRQRPPRGQLDLARTIAAGRSSQGDGITTLPASVYTDRG